MQQIAGMKCIQKRLVRIQCRRITGEHDEEREHTAQSRHGQVDPWVTAHAIDGALDPCPAAHPREFQLEIVGDICDVVLHVG